MLTSQTSGKIIILYNTSKSLLITSMFPNHLRDSAKFPLRGTKFGGGNLSRPGGTDSFFTSFQQFRLLLTVLSSGEGHGEKQNGSVCRTPDLRTADQSPKYLRHHKERLKSEHQENGAVSAKAHWFCLCLPELSTVYQNGNRWHKANARTFSQFPTK